MKNRIVGIIGTGPAALMAGTILIENGCDVHFFDHKKAAGRKFLVAGHGGFNLTNSEELATFCEKYDHDFLKKAVRYYSPTDFTAFLAKIGIETYEGTSGKIFPLKGIKPIEVLKRWLEYLSEKGASFHYEHSLVEFDDTNVRFLHRKTQINRTFDAVIFSLGGASWKQTGSTGSWIEYFEKKGVHCLPFQASNSGLELDTMLLNSELEGQQIKNCLLFSKEYSKMGDVLLTRYGIEGAPAYAMNRDFRNGNVIYIDFKPTLAVEEIEYKLKASKSVADGLKKLKLSKIAIDWLKKTCSKDEYVNASFLANRIKRFELQINGLRPIDEVISTVGGIAMDEIDSMFKLKNFRNLYAIGEMLDWDAPTGGYLIQGAVSTGAVAAKGILTT